MKRNEKVTPGQLIKEIKVCQQMADEVEPINELLDALIFRLSRLPNKELANNFINSADLQTLESAYTVLEGMYEGFFKEAQKAASKLAKL